MNELKELVKAYDILKECQKKASMNVGISFEFSNRMTASLGMAYTKKRLVRLSTPLWARIDEQEKHDTIVHEIAHIFANVKHRAHCRHDCRWKAMMRLLGIKNPDKHVYHNVPRNDLRRKNSRYKVTCTSCGGVMVISANLRSRWINARQVRRHTNCGALLTVAVAKRAKKV